MSGALPLLKTLINPKQFLGAQVDSPTNISHTTVLITPKVGIANIIVVLNLNCSLLFRCEHGDIWYKLELIFFLLFTWWFLVYTCTWSATCCFAVNLVHGTCNFWYVFEMLCCYTLNMVIFWYLFELLHCLFANTAIFDVYLNCYLLILCEHSNRWFLSSYM